MLSARHSTGRRPRRLLLWLAVPSLALAAATASLSGCGGGGGGGGGGTDPTTRTAVVLAWNDLGMHCMNQDFSELCILPPYNTLCAQVIDRTGDDPRIVTSSITLDYTVPGNTHSADKTNFWTYCQQLLGVSLAPDVGLAGNGLSGQMGLVQADNYWHVLGIPITPVQDSGQLDPYNLATVAVKRSGVIVATTQAVVPVSWEMHCDLCHNTAGKSTASDILDKHAALHPEAGTLTRPVLCASCHAEPNLGTQGSAGVASLSRAMHLSHGPRMAQSGLANVCYACHPGTTTQCLRDVHLSKGMTCTDCHGDMAAVADPARRPWVDVPKCGSPTCHHQAGAQYEQAGTRYRDSKGHGGVRCPACHGSPHAITPTVQPKDNLQAIALQGQAGTISKCTVCHRTQPGDSFFHSLSGD